MKVSKKVLLFLVVIVAITAGQLIKFNFRYSGITLLDICIIAWVFFKLLRLNFPIKRNQVYNFGLFFILTGVVSLILSPLKLDSYAYFVSFLYIVRITSYLLAGFLLISENLLQTKDVIQILLISGLILAILGILQIIFFPNLQFLEVYGWDPHYFRAVSTFLDPNFLGAYLILTLITLTIANYKYKFKKLFFITVYLCLIITFSRGNILMFITSFVLLSLILKSTKMFLLTTILSFGLILGYFVYEQTVIKPRNINKQQSADFRVKSWKIGKEIYMRYPILGIGFNSYRYALDELNLIPKPYLNSRAANSNDSSLLFIASTMGTVGLISFLFFIFSVFKESIKNYKKSRIQGLILIVGLTGLLVHSFFVNSIFYPPIFIWLVFMTSTLFKNHNS